MRSDALQTFKNITSSQRVDLGEIMTVFLRKYVKPQSMATAKPKFQRLVVNPANQKLIDFLDELQELAKNAFRVAAQATIEQFIYAKMPPLLKKSINQTQLENGTSELIARHLNTHCLTTIQKHGNYKKLYMVIDENLKVKKRSIEMYASMQVLKWQKYNLIAFKS